MKDLQIQLLYEQYNWSVERIAELLSTTAAVVQYTIDQKGYTQNQLTKTTEQTQVDIEGLKGVEVAKQQLVTPLITTVELSLFQKIMEKIEDCESPNEVAILVKAFKMLTQDAIVNAVVREEKANGKGPAIAVQIINEVA